MTGDDGVRDAMIVAGGAGTRLWPLTETTPKPLLPLCASPFLAGVLERLADAGVERVWLVVGADPTPFEVLEPEAARLGVGLRAVPEPTPLDTAGGVRAAAERVDGTFLVLNGDILTDVDLRSAIRTHRRARAAATLVLTRVTDTSSFGVCVRDGTRIVDFVEKPSPGTLPGQDTVNAGTYVLEPAAITRFPEGRLSFERTVFPGLVAAGEHVEGHVSDAYWADLGTRERYLDGHRRVLDGRVDWPTLQRFPQRPDGIRAADDVEVADDAQLVQPVLLAAGARVDAGARLGPNVVLGRDGRVGPGATLRDCVLGERAVVGAGSALTGVVTGPGARLGEGVTAPEGALIGDDEVVAAGRRLPAEARVPVTPTR
jgi:mannose-1-phosphate guanylyltransferase